MAYQTFDIKKPDGYVPCSLMMMDYSYIDVLMVTLAMNDIGTLYVTTYNTLDEIISTTLHIRIIYQRISSSYTI